LIDITQHIFNNNIGAQCSENSIQLIGELSGNEGYVAVCLGGSWGKVCGDSLYFGSLDDGLNAVVVVCRQLGLSTEGKTWHY
jgi:hypothetical protein